MSLRRFVYPALHSREIFAVGLLLVGLLVTGCSSSAPTFAPARIRRQLEFSTGPGRAREGDAGLELVSRIGTRGILCRPGTRLLSRGGTRRDDSIRRPQRPHARTSGHRPGHVRRRQCRQHPVRPGRARQSDRGDGSLAKQSALHHGPRGVGHRLVGKPHATSRWP